VQISQPDPQTPSGALIHVSRYLGNLPFRVWKRMQDIIQNNDLKKNHSRSSKHCKLNNNHNHCRKDERHK
ncbi:hypothetical protein QQF64_026059, partial [Cirrhinus molitorella]